MNIEVELEEDGRWIAEVPDLPGVMTYGQNQNDAISKRGFGFTCDSR